MLIQELKGILQDQVHFFLIYIYIYIYIYNYGSTQTYTKLKIYNHQTPKYSKGIWDWKEN